MHHHKWDGKKKRSQVCYYCGNNTIPKQVAPIDSIWTDCCIYYAIGACTTFVITGQDEMKVIELAKLIDEHWFPLSTNPGRADHSKVGLHCAGCCRGRGSNEMFAYRGIGACTKKKSAVARVTPFFSSRKYLA